MPAFRVCFLLLYSYSVTSTRSSGPPVGLFALHSGRFNTDGRLQQATHRKLQQAQTKLVGSDTYFINNEYGFNALLQIIVGPIEGQYRIDGCTGTLVTPDRVLTSAHCCVENDPSQPQAEIYGINVIVGAFTLGKAATELDAAADVLGAETRYVERYWFPEGYLNADLLRKTAHDVCVIELNAPVDIAPALLASKTLSRVPAGISAVIYGWGDQEVAQAPAPPPPVFRLKGLNAQTFDCNDIDRYSLFGTPIDYTTVWDRESQTPMFICLPPSATAGACHGDSGGPLILNGVVRGVVAVIIYSPFAEQGMECLPGNTGAIISLNIAAPVIADFIAKALAE